MQTAAACEAAGAGATGVVEVSWRGQSRFVADVGVLLRRCDRLYGAMVAELRELGEVSANDSMPARPFVQIDGIDRRAARRRPLPAVEELLRQARRR
ncbi:MAG: hypothetical protein KF830_15930 [Planctomycetes bacterium]|nr:hypothetical protein [Planctomycetota bacterium]